MYFYIALILLILFNFISPNNLVCNFCTAI